jgi:sugar phosphate isomerase/epimerase
VSPATQHQLGLCSVSFRRLSPDAVIALAAASGVSAIEWGADIHVPPGQTALARQVARRCHDAGIRISSYGSYVEAGVADQPIDAVLDTAAALGASTVRVWAGKRGVGSADATPPARQASIEALQTIARKAAHSGLAVALEFHPRTLTDTADSAVALMTAVGQSNLGSYWQPRPGIGVAESLAELALLSGRLYHLHVFAWNAASERLPLAAHEKLWLPRLQASRTIAMPRGAFRVAMIEFVSGDSADAFSRDAETLKGWLAAIDWSSSPVLDS